MILTDVLYPASFLLALLGLISWMMFPNSKGISAICRALFFIGSLSWVACLVVIEADMSQKAFIGARDMLALGVMGWIIQQARSNRAVALALFIGTGFFVRFSYLDILQDSFHQIEQEGSHAELLIKWTNPISLEQAQKMLASHDIEISQAFHPQDINNTELDNYFVIDCDAEKTASVRQELSKIKAIEWIEENEIITIDDELGDIIEATTSDSSDPLLSQQWAMQSVNSSLVHQIIAASGKTQMSKIKVAILDTGVDAKHEDLGDHYQSTQKKYDSDPRGHGTHVAGIVAGVTGNGKGIGSLIPAGFENIEITSVAVLNALGRGTQETVIDGMIEAADNGANIISMSLGGRSTDEKQQTYNEAVAYCNLKGAIVIVAAGNANNNAKLNSPANTKGVIAVAATDASNKRAFFSSMVQDIDMGLAAPGVDIMSTWPANKYRKNSGTSMATPLVSAAAALLLSVDPSLNTSEMYDLLASTGITSNQPAQTGPIIQPAAAMERLLEKSPVVSSSLAE